MHFASGSFASTAFVKNSVLNHDLLACPPRDFVGTAICLKTTLPGESIFLYFSQSYQEVPSLIPGPSHCCCLVSGFLRLIHKEMLLCDAQGNSDKCYTVEYYVIHRGIVFYVVCI